MARRFHRLPSWLTRTDDERPTSLQAGLERYRYVQARKWAHGQGVDSNVANPIHRWLSPAEAQVQRSERARRAEVEAAEQRHRYPLSRETRAFYNSRFRWSWER